MASRQHLKEAEYISRGDDGDYIEELGQCGFSPCDCSEIVKDNITGEEYRYCMKLQMPVGLYDSCKYHSAEKSMDLIRQLAELFKEEETLTKKAHANQKQKSKRMLIMTIVCIAVFIFLLIK